MDQRNNVQIAYIIQCHKNAEQINLLAKHLANENNDVYIHLDAKSNDVRKNIITSERVTLLTEQESVSVHWGRFDQCLATIALLRKVINCKKQYDYVWLISGQDFPIKSNFEINRLLSEQKETVFMQFIKDDSVLKRFDKRNNLYHPNWMFRQKTYVKVLRRIWYVVSGGMNYTFPMFRRKRIVEYYYGSQWWCLPYNCVCEMLRYIDMNEEILKFYEHSMCPDESFFQTLVMQTSYADKQKDYLTYVDWSQKKSSPKVIGSEDWDILMKESYRKCFARKFDLEIDRQVVSRLIMELSNEKTDS